MSSKAYPRDIMTFEEKSRKLKDDPIFNEIQMASSNSTVFIKIDYSLEKASKSDYEYDFLCRRGESLDVSAKIVYVRQGRIRKGPSEVTVKLEPVRNMAKRKIVTSLTEEEFVKRSSRHLSEKGTYDSHLLYDATRLISYPELNSENNTIKLNNRDIKHFKFRITIPEDFPDDLLNDVIHLTVGGQILEKGIGMQSGHIRLLVTA